MLELSVGDHFRKYELRRLLGKGSVGVVWEAFDPILEQRVALKLFDPESEERLRGKKFELRKSFLGEARALGRLRPTNHRERCEAVRVAQVFDADVEKESGLYFLSQEFVDGVTLSEVLKTQWNSFSRRQKEKLMRNIIKSVRYAHDRGVPHGDISLSNFLVEDSLNARLVDFGMSSLGIPSSILYLAPELIGGGKRSFQSDAWSLGVVLYRMKYGRFPFRLERASLEEHDAAKSSLDDVVKTAEEYSEMCRKVREETPLSTSRGLFPILRNGFGRLLEKNSAKRYSAKKALWYARDENLTMLKFIGGMCMTGVVMSLGLHLTHPPNSSVISARPLENVVEKVELSSLADVAPFLRRSSSYNLKCSPMVWEPSPDRNYVLYSDTRSWYLFDVSSGESLLLPINPARDSAILLRKREAVFVTMDGDVRSFSYVSPFDVFGFGGILYASPLRGMSRHKLLFAKQLCMLKNDTVLCMTPQTIEGFHGLANRVISLVDSPDSTLDEVIPAPRGESVYIWAGGVQYFFENAWGSLHSTFEGSEREFPKRLKDLPVLTETLFRKRFVGEWYAIERDGAVGVYDGIHEQFFPLQGCSRVLSAFSHNGTVYAVALREDKTGDDVVDVRDGQLFRVGTERLVPMMGSKGAFVAGGE